MWDMSSGALLHAVQINGLYVKSLETPSAMLKGNRELARGPAIDSGVLFAWEKMVVFPFTAFPALRQHGAEQGQTQEAKAAAA